MCGPRGFGGRRRLGGVEFGDWARVVRPGRPAYKAGLRNRGGVKWARTGRAGGRREVEFCGGMEVASSATGRLTKPAYGAGGGVKWTGRAEQMAVGRLSFVVIRRLSSERPAGLQSRPTECGDGDTDARAGNALVLVWDYPPLGSGTFAPAPVLPALTGGCEQQSDRQ